MIRPQLKEFMRRMAPKSVAIIPGAHDTRRSNDTHYRFRQDSDFFYLTGFEEPDALAVIKPRRRQEVHVVCAAKRSGTRDLGRTAGWCRRREE
jgi:Xaa-Pro aminopeptidase